MKNKDEFAGNYDFSSVPRILPDRLKLKNQKIENSIVMWPLVCQGIFLEREVVIYFNLNYCDIALPVLTIFLNKP